MTSGYWIALDHPSAGFGTDWGESHMPAETAVTIPALFGLGSRPAKLAASGVKAYVPSAHGS